MGLTGSGRKAAVLCTAVVLLGSLALPAGAAPLTGAAVPALSVPASPEIPSPEEIAAAKASESATADQVTRIDRILADAASAQEASFAAAMQANNAYGDALVTLGIRRDAAALASAKAVSAQAEQAKTRKQVGQLAGDLYRNGGLNPALSTFVSGNGEVLKQAATLEAISASRSRAFEAADNAASAAQSLTAAAEDANRAADDAARSAEDRKVEAERANAAQAKAVSEAKAQRTVLVDQLASLKNTTVALESARVDALDHQRAQERLAAVTAAAASQAAAQAEAAPNSPAPGAPAPAPDAPAAPTPANPAPANPAPPAPGPPAPVVPAPAEPAPVVPAPAVPAPAPAPVPAPSPAPSPGGSNQTAISVALGKVGSPYFYKYGGSGPLGFDCSGLVQNAFAAAGKYLPRTAAQQYAQAPVHVPLSQAQPGDLLVWGSAPDFYHVAIYLGGGRVVQALSPDDGITVTDLTWMAGMQLHPTVARY
ncbi:glycoside hydrolase [Arthrobacter sp. Leaf337]|uniref:C40 family peptidase n=1 Tax=Arthrobacter sp. Leaf337 TaxID=1736342 RepID=UPI0006FC95EF|nr:C40 family peptidase [Arthrobacter sp. Leaf337]KQR75150.1 glycoside hydrolase [Arthrobacter sp. Leaf337]